MSSFPSVPGTDADVVLDIVRMDIVRDVVLADIAASVTMIWPP